MELSALAAGLHPCCIAATLKEVEREEQSVGVSKPRIGLESTDKQPLCRVWLRAEGQDKLVLHPGVTRVGRDARCEIVFDDPLISRKHAQFTVRGASVTLEDLGSTNGVVVNGSRLLGSQALTPGDRVVLGRYEAELCLVQVGSVSELEPRPPSREVFETLVDVGVRAAELTASTRRVPTGLPALAELAEKALNMRDGAAAGRILKHPLNALLTKVKQKGKPDLAEIELAGYLAARLAILLTDPTWIDYVFRLLKAARQLPSTRVVDQVYQAVAQVSGADPARLRRYLELTQEAELGQLSPGERFLVRRLEGLAGQL